MIQMFLAKCLFTDYNKNDKPLLLEKQRKLKMLKQFSKRLKPFRGKEMKLIKRLFITVFVITALAAGVIWLYLSDYRSADADAIAAFTHPEGFVEAVTEADNRIVFTPYEGTDTAVIFYPGAKVRYDAYSVIAEKLAENGIMCILVDMPMNLAILNAEAAEDVKEAHPEIKHWYIAGHSMGGLAAGSCAAEYEDEYDGLIVIASRIKEDFSGSELPVLLITATNDGICTPELLEKEKTPLPKHLTHVVIEGGCHGYFGSYGDQPHDGVPDITREDQQEQTITAIVNWISAGN